MRRALWLIWVLACAAAPASAQEEMGALLSPVLGSQKAAASFEGSVYPARPVENQDTRLRLERQEARVLVPLAADAEGECGLDARVGRERLDTGARLPESGARLPGELWDLRLGAGCRRRLDRGRILGGRLTIGSPSDRPFSGWDQTALGATASLRVPSGPQDAWLLSLNYSTVRGFLDGWPLPGVAYAWLPSERLRAVIGVPFAFCDAQPIDALRIQVRLFPMAAGASATWRLRELLHTFAAFDWGGHEYLRAGRDARRDRLRLREASVRVGLRFGASSDASLDLFGGYAFARTVSEGRRAFADHDNEIQVGEGPFAGLRAAARF